MTQRNTRQLAVTLSAVRALACHPSADMVYDYIHTGHPKMSRATVYRNLNKLCRQGDLSRVRVPGCADRFDHSTRPHYHFVCNRCGRVEDLDMPYMPDIDSMRGGHDGRKITRHTIIFEGVCADCLQKERH